MFPTVTTTCSKFTELQIDLPSANPAEPGERPAQPAIVVAADAP